MHIQASNSNINVSHIHSMKIFPAVSPDAGCSRWRKKFHVRSTIPYFLCQYSIQQWESTQTCGDHRGNTPESTASCQVKHFLQSTHRGLRISNQIWKRRVLNAYALNAQRRILWGLPQGAPFHASRRKWSQLSQIWDVCMLPKKIIATVSARESNLKLHAKSSHNFKHLLSHWIDIIILQSVSRSTNNLVETWSCKVYAAQMLIS